MINWSDAAHMQRLSGLPQFTQTKQTAVSKYRLLRELRRGLALKPSATWWKIKATKTVNAEQKQSVLRIVSYHLTHYV